MYLENSKIANHKHLSISLHLSKFKMTVMAIESFIRSFFRPGSRLKCEQNN